MTGLWLVLPILAPLITAAACLLLRGSLRAQMWLGLFGMLVHFAASAKLLETVWKGKIVVLTLGAWPAPYGIALVADLFSSMMVGVASVIGVAVGIYSAGMVDAARFRFGYIPLYCVLLAGVCGSFLTGDLFNLYVWFEVLLMASFVLLSLGSERAQLEAAIKYVTLNLMASVIFLAGVGITYGATGTLNLAALALQLRESPPGMVNMVAMLFLVAFGIKAAVFPLFFWLPASYHTPPVAVSALFAALLTKVGVYALIRVFTLLFIGDPGFTHNLILAIAGLTMLTGVLGAVAQNSMRRILSFHIISQIGYMLMGLGLFIPLGLAGSVFYIAHHIIVKANLFLVSGVVARKLGTEDLSAAGGLYRRTPLLSIIFLISALSLAGLPPLSGFWAKLALVRAGLETADYGIVVVALLVSLLTLFSMTKIWSEVFWKERPEGADNLIPAGPLRAAMTPAAGLAVVTLLIGFAAGPVFVFAQRVAGQLLQPQEYIRAVLGGP
jgi:multicomponent Na+:H+ antiporter subunit D